MFEPLIKSDSNFLEVLRQQATPYIVRDRQQYEPVYATIRNVASNAIFSDVLKLLHQTDPLTFRPCEIYCENPQDLAMEITNQIYKKHEPMVQMNTVSPYEFEVKYDNRVIAVVFAILKGRDIDIHDLIQPIQIDGHHYMSPEIELIDVYQSLYSPNKAEQWESLLPIEHSLFDLVQQRSASETRDASVATQPDLASFAKSPIMQFKVRILNELLCQRQPVDPKQPARVLVGHWAYTVMNSNNQGVQNIEKLQYISSNAEEDIAMIKRLNPKHKITHQKHILHLPKDFRIKRYTLYFGDNERAFLDIFNAMEFELIPYNVRTVQPNAAEPAADPTKTGTIKVGNPYVLMRFFMIDLWMVRVIHRLGKLPLEVMNAKVKVYHEILQHIRENQGSDRTFGPSFSAEYDGVYIDYATSKKLERLRFKKTYPYIPALLSANRNR